MQRYNKTTAAALGGLLLKGLALFFPETATFAPLVEPLVVAGLVWAVPNRS